MCTEALKTGVFLAWCLLHTFYRQQIDSCHAILKSSCELILHSIFSSAQTFSLNQLLNFISVHSDVPLMDQFK